MLEYKGFPRPTANLLPRAFLLCRKDPSPEDQNLSELLDLFGIPWRAVTVDEISRIVPGYRDDNKFCILSSAPCAAEAIRDTGGDRLPQWMMAASSVYLYGFHDADLCKELLRFLTKDPRGNIRRLDSPQTTVSIVNDAPEMCGPLSGMRVPIEQADGDLLFDVAHQGSFQDIVSANQGELFFGVTCEGVHFYLSGAFKTVRVRSGCSEFFDVKRHFSAAVPIVMYLKWAYRDILWERPEINGCLIVDDISLKSRYGFLHFRDALELMDSYNFTTAIAFIPWNWRRTSHETVSIFQTRPDRFSLCIHGCDHTRSEFATRSTGQLNRRIKDASHRMESLLQRTSLPHARIMVFPQGAFSPETGRALKLNGFVAAVNTEVAPSNDASNETTMADLWNVAILKYGTFPIFTRRYMSHGIENFAFDGLLGKPCLIAAHHEVFRNHGRDLVDFVAKLNSLKWNFRWRPLGDAISHSYSVGRQPDGSPFIRMFGESLTLENPSDEPIELALAKEEGDFDCLKAVLVNQDTVDFTCDERQLRWIVKLAPKQMAHTRIIYFDKLEAEQIRYGVGYRTKTMVRRYLSEFRDNYLSQSEFLSARGRRIKQLLHSSFSWKA